MATPRDGSGWSVWKQFRALAAPRQVLTPSPEQFADDRPLADDHHRSAAGGVVFLLVIDAERLVEGCGDLIRREATLGRAHAAGVAGADDLPTPHSAAGQERGHGPRPVVAAGASI